MLFNTSEFISFDCVGGARFVILHKAAVTDHLGPEYSREFALESVARHDPPPREKGFENPG
jgi:hypothetical protein